ncbi:hypothetical protein [Arenibaculum pallidiluteum]|uniref:hypothetical protein n=1 Tax=Arenibaculum pallidiluteum TaxID=2812559 RepID=UPI001A95B09C|nr:hypothetical protein [Arenibaculum pallidiluteum]
MAKKKGKKAAIPKRIAGIKVPKALRKSGIPLASIIDSPTGRAVLADALMHAARILSDTRPAQNAAAGAGHAMRDAGEGATGLLSEAAQKLAAVISPQDGRSGGRPEGRSDARPDGDEPRHGDRPRRQEA